MTEIPAAELHSRWIRRDPDYRREFAALEEEFALASALIAARTRAGLSQAQLAQRMNTTQAAIARLESGRGKPSARMLERFADATGTRLKITFKPAMVVRSRDATTYREINLNGRKSVTIESIIGEFVEKYRDAPPNASAQDMQGMVGDALVKFESLGIEADEAKRFLSDAVAGMDARSALRNDGQESSGDTLTTKGLNLHLALS